MLASIIMKHSDKTKMQRIALETAQRLIDYDSYGKSESKAIYAMKRRFSGLSKADYKNFLDDAIAVHKDAIRYVKSNSDAFFKSYAEKPDGSGLHLIADDFINKYPSYQADDLVGTLAFVFYLYHLR